jgi:hypothetical protein
MGIVDAYGAVDSRFTGDHLGYHAETWPCQTHGRWRWNWRDSIYCFPDKLNSEQYDAVMSHMEKKYGIKFWDNGHHDIDHFLAQIDREKQAKA